MRSLSVELKLGIAVLAACLVAGYAGAELVGGIFARNIEDVALSTLQNAEDAFASQERSDVEKLAATLDALLANDDLREAFVARDRARLLAAAAPLFATMKARDRVTHWYFIEPEPARTVFLRVHRPELFGDRVDRATLDQAIETRELGAGKELGKTAFALRAVRPWFHRGELLGYVELSEEIDHFLTAMKSRTGDEYGLLVKKKFLDEESWARVLGPRSNTWNDRADVVVVDTTTFTEGIIDYAGELELVPDRGQALGEAVRGERAYVRGIFPVRDAAGQEGGRALRPPRLHPPAHGAPRRAPAGAPRPARDRRGGGGGRRLPRSPARLRAARAAQARARGARGRGHAPPEPGRGARERGRARPARGPAAARALPGPFAAGAGRGCARARTEPLFRAPVIPSR